MPSYALQREIPLDDRWDVIVVGGGPAGCTAAAAAAREGASTLLVEATGCLGGMGTGGLVPAWMTFGDQQKMIIRGMAEHIFVKASAGLAHATVAECWGPIDAERLKRVYDDLITASGAVVQFHTMLSGVEVDDAGRVTALLLSSKNGLTACRARTYVDATGDGDLACWAGAEYVQGEEGTGEVMPVTHCFLLSNVDDYAFTYGPSVYSTVIAEILASGDYPEIADAHCCANLVGPGTVGFNAGHQWDVDNTDPVSVSRAMVQGRKIAVAFRDALARFYPTAFANAHLAVTASLLGARESRRIMGDYILTVDDFLARRSFPDEICRNAYPIDIHTAKDEIADNRAGHLNVMERYQHFAPGESHGIPYRCLIPSGIPNVLVAGRAISCDRPVQASIRIMPVCLGLGEAAGIAAACAARMPAPDVHAVDTCQLRRRLIEEGGYLPEFATIPAGG